MPRRNFIFHGAIPPALMTPCQLDLCISILWWRETVTQYQNGGPPGYHVPVCQLSRARMASRNAVIEWRLPRQVPENIEGNPLLPHNRQWRRGAQRK